MESVQHYINEGTKYDLVLPDINQWPIAQLFTKKDLFIGEVIEDSMDRLRSYAGQVGQTVPDVIERTMFLERIRMKEDPWKVDPKDEHKFWSQIKKELVLNEQIEQDPGSFDARTQRMLRDITDRYANEIVNTFKPGSYHFAKRFLPFFFSTLLNASAGKTFKSIVNHSVQLQERVHLLGHIEQIRNLATKGTVVLVPTHLSNVDSILVGWALSAIGMPAFIYGAGLNLFNNKALAYFMGRLGAYKVDRRKRNPIYRSTLDAYSTIAIQEGVHSLFFPGGTRSRSGMIEDNLKLGLLGTAMEAQRRNFITKPRGVSDKIFVVPMVMSYHFVLEANSLIRQHLTRTGQEQYYILNDESNSYTKFLSFIWSFFRSSSDISLNFGKPMDLFGNFVDENGVSHDSHGREIDIKSYFKSGGKISKDPQRDNEYTRMLGEKIVERYHAENYVFSSHVIAFVAFEMLKKKYSHLDVYGLLRLTEEDRKINRVEFAEVCDRVIERLRNMAKKSKVNLAQHMINDTTSIIDHGIKNLGIYHDKRTLTYVDEQTISTENMNLLYYYHNRLEGYGLKLYI